MKTCICYSIDFVPQLEAFLPSAYIVEIKGDELGYMQKVASLETLASFAIEWENTDHSQILSLIDSINPENITKSFSKGKKRMLSLDKLFQDDLIKNAIQQRVHKTLDQVLSIIAKNNYPLCDAIERKVFLEDIRINTEVKNVEPKLYFQKTQTGLNYRLALKWNGQEIPPFYKDVKVLTDKEGWLIIDYQLLKLASINGNKLKPFLKKEHIFIPSRIQKEYFEKFIKDIIGKVESEVEGFTVIEHEEKPFCRLFFVEDLMSGKMKLSPVFHYGNSEFRFFDNSKQRVKISFSKDIQVQIIRRDLTFEQKLINQLSGLGLQFNNGLFSDDIEDKFSMIGWVSNHKSHIEEYDFELVTPKVDNLSINLDQHSLAFSFANGNDWFDLHAVIQVGEEQLIFADLIAYIADGNRFFPLKNGTSFIIPAEWMNTYGNVAKFSTVTNGKVKLSSKHFTLLDDLETATSSSTKVYKVEDTEFDYQVSNLLKAELRTYQLEGAKWLVRHYLNGFGSLLADDMGLGKTIQTLAVLLHAKENLKEKTQKIESQQLSLFGSNYNLEFSPLKALIVLPASLIFNWAEEIKKFAPTLMVTIYKGENRSKIDIEKFDIILTSYQTASIDFAILKSINFSFIILDESHYIKNRNTQLFTNINQLNTEHKISLSGTPIENSLSDLYTQMEFINPDILGSYSFFKKHFKEPIEKHKDEEALNDLNTIIAPFILRRTKEEVLDDLPDMQESVIYSEMGKAQKTLYEQEKSAARNYLLGLDNQTGEYKIHVFNLLLRLRKLANHPRILDEESTLESAKFNDVTAYLDTVVRSNNKVLVFTSFLSQIALYSAYCHENNIDFEVLTGKTPVKSRAAIIDRFKKEDSKQVFFISLKTGGVGLNLTEANYVIILDPWWNPFAERQAIGRSHRIGQREKVIVTRFITKDTVEDKILKLQQDKLKIAGDIIDIGEQPDLTPTSISFLLN